MRYFTICNDETSLKKYSWGGRPHYSLDRHRHSSNRAILLFGTDDPHEKLSVLDIYAIAQSQYVREKFGAFFVELDATENKIEVHNDIRALELPDKYAKGDYVELFVNGEATKLDLHKRYNDCTEMIKRALGCSACPLRGPECVGMALGSDVKLMHNNPDTFQAELKHFKDVVAGFTYVSPVMTKPTDLNNVEYFMPALRDPAEHAFDQVGEWVERKKEHAQKAAVSRKFINRECNRCVYKDADCKAYSHCAGRYPPQELYAKYIMQHWNERIQDPEKNPFQPWQFWALARHGGDESVKRHRRMHVLLEGLVYSGGFYAGIGRAKTRLGRLEKTRDWDLLCDLFPNLPRTEAAVLKWDKKPESIVPIALYLASLDVHFGYSYRGNEKTIIWRELDENYLRYNVAVCGERFHGRPWEVATFARYMETFRRKPYAPQGDDQLSLDIAV